MHTACDRTWSAACFASLTAAEQSLALNRLSPRELAWLTKDWRFWARHSQLAPPGDWRVWLFLGGRGAGKTRAGAEWIRAEVARGARRIALVAPSLHDAREVMVSGPSGLLAVAGEREKPVFEVSRRRLLWPNGAEGFVFSAEDPDSLRGPQFDRAWCDEIAAWPKGETVWDMLMFGLRLGDQPRVMATTTPRPTALLRRLVADPATSLTHARTADNAAHLAEGFVAGITAAYAGSRLARQELQGELLEDVAGALWTRAGLDAARWDGPVPDLVAVAIGVDPPASTGPEADACGMIAAGRDRAGVLWVLEDASARGLAPIDWAGRVAALARRYPGASVIAEANQGGAMVGEVLRLAGVTAPVELVHAREAKLARAEPVAVLYARARVHHAGRFDALEDEMVSYSGTGPSPDRLDALVWALRGLMRPNEPRLRQL